ncbi:MAG TPA: hypothetical protein VEW93_11050 [Acidimicrobiales bacterium]|nr:hypothetical protein [Acidimicrobiales bacterium]
MGRRVDADDLVGAGEIAERLGLAHVPSAHNLFRRHADFPEPVATVGRVRIWAWPDVEKWAKATGRLP